MTAPKPRPTCRTCPAPVYGRGSIHCGPCRAAERTRRMREYRARHDATHPRVRRGTCQVCGSPSLTPGATYCAKHRGRDAQRAAAWRAGERATTVPCRIAGCDAKVPTLGHRVCAKHEHDERLEFVRRPDGSLMRQEPVCEVGA